MSRNVTEDRNVTEQKEDYAMSKVKHDWKKVNRLNYLRHKIDSIEAKITPDMNYSKVFYYRGCIEMWSAKITELIGE